MGFARSRAYWQQIAWGLLFGLLGGLGALVFVTIVERGLRLLWPTAYGWQPFSGSWTHRRHADRRGAGGRAAAPPVAR